MLTSWDSILLAVMLASGKGELDDLYIEYSILHFVIAPNSNPLLIATHYISTTNLYKFLPQTFYNLYSQKSRFDFGNPTFRTIQQCKERGPWYIKAYPRATQWETVLPTVHLSPQNYLSKDQVTEDTQKSVTHSTRQ